MRTIVIAPHPDDETLGVGGTLLRKKAEGNSIGWLIVTSISTENGWNEEIVNRRKNEIHQVAKMYDFDKVYHLNFNPSLLDKLPLSTLIAAVSDVFQKFEPEEVFVPHPSDAHSDHRIIFDAAVACTKWFRYPSVKRILAYETLSETESSLRAGEGFRPNVYMDIENYLSRKLQLMDIYTSELEEFPFPRSHEAINALAAFRGASSGFKAAEAFELLRERY